MADAKPILARPLDTWRKCVPEAIAHRQSRVAIEFTFTDARHDILALADFARQLLIPLRALTQAARTTGGTPGPDSDLMLACELAERAIARATESYL